MGSSLFCSSRMAGGRKLRWLSGMSRVKNLDGHLQGGYIGIIVKCRILFTSKSYKATETSRKFYNFETVIRGLG